MRLTGVLLCAALAGASTARATDWWVDAATGIDLPGRGSPADPFRTITFAVASATFGDAIQVLPGTYDNGSGGETFPIKLWNISLTGSGAFTTAGGASTVSVHIPLSTSPWRPVI